MQIMISASDQRRIRKEFWEMKARDALRGEMRDAQRRGDPEAFYRARAKFEDFVITCYA